MTLKNVANKFLPCSMMLVLGHVKVHGRLPNLLRPQSMSEKILWRNLFDRRPILTKIADKAEVRNYVAERLGAEVLPRLYHLTDDADTIPFDDLPKRFVVKPTHGSGWVRVVLDKDILDRAELIATCKDWLKRNYYKEAFEPVYRDIRPQIMIEEYIDDRQNIVPTDYKLFVFHGQVHVVEVIKGRLTGRSTAEGRYTPDWERLPVRGYLSGYFSKSKIKDSLQIDYEVPPPPHLTTMIAAAELLGREWDFIRVDFYDTAERLYFGEITLTPAAGRERFDPVEHDYRLGKLW